MSKLGFLVAVSVVSLGAAVGAWYYKYQLYGWLPSTASSELKNVDGLLMDKEGKPFTGRVKDISDSGYSLYAYRKLFKNPCSQAELNKIVPFGFSLQRQKMVFFLPSK